MSAILLNFSGHKFCQKTRQELELKYSIIQDVPFYEIDFGENVEFQLEELFRCVETPLDGSLPVSIIPPGQSTLAIILMVFIHGILGYFPKICLLESKGSGEYIPTNIFCIDGYNLRKAGRSFRQEAWKDSNPSDTSQCGKS